MLARLEKEGLTPAPPAERAQLFRRACLDLTGLPPTAEEMDRFLADRSPTRTRGSIDRLLASPHYGERMAPPWLDAPASPTPTAISSTAPRTLVAVARLGHPGVQR